MKDKTNAAEKPVTEVDRLKQKVRQQRKTIKTLRARARGGNSNASPVAGMKKGPQAAIRNVDEYVQATRLGLAILRSA